MDKRTEAVPPSKRKFTEKEILTYYLVTTELELFNKMKRNGVEAREFRNLAVEIDARNTQNIDDSSFNFKIRILSPDHIPILRSFERAAKKEFARPDLPDENVAQLERLNQAPNTGAERQELAAGENKERLKLVLSKDRKSINVSIRVPGGLALLYDLKDYIDPYLLQKEFAKVREVKANSFKPVGPFSAMIAKEKIRLEPSHELPKALGELLDAAIAKIELRIAPELEKKQQKLEKGERMAPFKFSAVIPLNITDWRDQLLFVGNLHGLLQNKMKVTNRELLDFHVVYPDKGINLCFIGPQLQTVIEYPAGLKTLKELRRYIERFPKEITHQNFPLLHDPVRPPHNERELMVDLLDTTQASLRDLYTKLKTVDARLISSYLGRSRVYRLREKNKDHQVEYAQAVLKYESSFTADIFTDILQSLTRPDSPEMRQQVYGILFDFFHPHSLELYTSERVAEDATSDLCFQAMKRLEEMMIVHNEQAIARTSREITLRYNKNGSLQAMAQLLSVMMGDEMLRECWIARYAKKIYQADHMRENVSFADDVISVDEAKGSAFTR